MAVVGDRAEALAELERLYAELPDLACKGLCGHSCTQHVDASTTERDRLLAEDGLDLDAPTPDGACPALTRTLAGTGTGTGTGSCTVHPHRPMTCRLWGTAASMPCPHGCTPTGGHLTRPRHPAPAPHQPGNRRAPPHRHPAAPRAVHGRPPRRPAHGSHAPRGPHRHPNPAYPPTTSRDTGPEPLTPAGPPTPRADHPAEEPPPITDQLQPNPVATTTPRELDPVSRTVRVGGQAAVVSAAVVLMVS